MVCDRRICVSAAVRGPPVTESYSTAPICRSHCYVRRILCWSGRICSFVSSQHAGSHNSLQLWRNTATDFRMTGQFFASSYFRPFDQHYPAENTSNHVTHLASLPQEWGFQSRFWRYLSGAWTLSYTREFSIILLQLCVEEPTKRLHNLYRMSLLLL